jgi:tRNA U34 5-carboxymethylaminomethyl modifying GTPase MnmE/TrmE
VTEEKKEELHPDIAEAFADHPLKDDPEFIAVQNLIRSNTMRLAVYAQRGIGLDQQSLLEQRMELLIEVLMPNNSRERTAFEHKFADQITEAIDKIDSEIDRLEAEQRKQALLAPGGAVGNGGPVMPAPAGTPFHSATRRTK